jgi:hypothetical protein
MSYQDANNNAKPVIFRYGTVTGDEGLDTPYPGNAKILGGIGNNMTSIDPGTADGAQVVATNSSTHKGGVYTAVGSLALGANKGRALIAWNDEANGNLVFSYSTGVDESALLSTSTSVWQGNARIIDSGDLAGWYVDMAVDSDDGIHLAWYNSGSQDLKYAYLSAYNEAFQVVTVDSYLSPGTKLMINVRKEGANQVPYISYYHLSLSGTRNAARVAWREDFSSLKNGAVSDQFTGAWEVMSVPTNNIPAEDYICNGVPSTGTFNKTGANLANSVVLGYLTGQKRYEWAYIKR